MSTHLIEGQIFKLTTCKTCGARHLLPNDMFEGLREIGGYYHCPNGHGWGWRTGTERAAEEERQRQLDAARRERDLARQRIAQVEDEKREAIAEAEARTKAAEAATPPSPPVEPPMDSAETPPPGSDAAIAAGCTCPVYDNAHGRGYMGMAGVYAYTAGCPLHGAGDDDGQPTEQDEWRDYDADC